MSRNNTGNPIGSKAFPDFEDNVKNLDEAVNTADPQWVDRFGRFRLPLMEQERQFVSDQERREGEFQADQSSREAVFSDFLQASGYQDLGEYAPGIEITAHNQYVTFGGQPYLLKPSIPVPYTTSGEWTGEDFKLIGDDSLRQDLANPDNGAAMVARGVVAVDSIADLLALPEGQRKAGIQYVLAAYHQGSDAGGGIFYYDPSRVDENDEGTVFNGMVRVREGMVSAAWFGAVLDSVTDNTEILIKAAVAAGELNTRGVVEIPPGCNYNLNSLLGDERLPASTIFHDLSVLGALNTPGYKMGVLGYISKGAVDQDYTFNITSGHNAVLSLENTGSSGSTSALGRGASISWGVGRYNKGGSEGGKKSGCRLSFGKSIEGDFWEMGLRANAPWGAIATDWFRWLPEVEDVESGDFCFSPLSSNWYVAQTSGTTGQTPPTHTEGAESDGGVAWEFYDYTFDGRTLVVDELGRIATNGSIGTDSVKLKQSRYSDQAIHRVSVEGTGESRSVRLALRPTDASGSVVLDAAEFRSSHDIGLHISSGGAIVQRWEGRSSVFGGAVALSTRNAGDGDATPDVLGVSTLNINNSTPTVITGLDNGIVDQVVTMVFQNANTTVQNGSIRLSGASDQVFTQFSTLTLRRVPWTTSWIEVSRSLY